jgi:phosphatidylglycerol:prolipoprotein diacylglycerol transferase
MLAYVSFPPWLHPEIIPGLPLRWYGMMYLLAFAVAYAIVRVQVRERNLDVPRDDVLNLFFWGVVGLLVGARLFYVAIYGSAYFLRQPLQIIVPLSISGGRLRFTGLAGMSYHGGLIGAVAAMVIYLRAKRMPVLDWGDMIAGGTALGYTFGRLGNFINGELYGRITAAPWGMVFPLAERFPAKEAWVQEFASRIRLDLAGLGAAGEVNLPRHPSQLYEAFFEGIVLWAILWFIVRKRKAFPGQLLAIYVMGYGLVRFLIEYVRQPDTNMGFPIQLVRLGNPYVDFSPFNFTTGQILNTIMIATGVCCYLLFRGHFLRVQAEKARREPARPAARQRRRLRKKLR